MNETEVKATADQHAESIRKMLGEVSKLGIDLSSIERGAKSALEEMERHAANLLCQALLPTTTLEQIIKLQALLGIIESERYKPEHLRRSFGNPRGLLAAEVG